MKNNVKFTLNPANPAPLTDDQETEIKYLSEMPDGKIDFSDAPALPAEFWKAAVLNPFYRPTKTSTTVRMDSDVLAWLKSEGKGYQTRINAILRAAMLREIKH